MAQSAHDLQIQALVADFEGGRRDPLRTLEALHREAQRTAERNIWITLLDWPLIARQFERVQARRVEGKSLPLFGVPFAIKDNIDLAGVVTSAACPGYGRVAEHSAPVVAALLEAGAIAFGKTNLDQFATGLVGTRSPYGICGSAHDPKFISGGSSSGSALAVALGQVSFALGTDTAGSGRVPAALNNVVGLKPTKGLCSTRGVVPACRSLDTISVFAGNVQDALTVLDIAAGFDPEDEFSRPQPPGSNGVPALAFFFGVPRATELEFFGDELSARAYVAALAQLERIGGQRVEIDFAPFRQVAELLYGGPWIAERQAAVGEYIAEGKPGLDPVVQAVIAGSPRLGAVEAFQGQYRLRQLSRQIAPMWQQVDVLVVPTVPTTYSHAEIAADPIGRNSRLGIYTNFTNLLDLCGVAVPTGFKAHGRPFGVTLLGPAFADRAVASLASRLHGVAPAGVGATGTPVLAPPASFPRPPAARAIVQRPVARIAQSVRVAVVGAHLSGQPLHRELVELGARFEQLTRSAPLYRLFVLPNSMPAKPGLLRASRGGAAVELEVYALDAVAFGEFVTRIVAPLGIGNVQLENGDWVKGFLCEAIACEGATEISALGGWRAYLDRPR